MLNSSGTRRRMPRVFLIIIIVLPPIHCSCFVQSSWTTARPLLQMIDPSATIGACESACLGNSQCLAYAFVNAKCALLGQDSGKPQTCSSANPVCYVRTAACDAVTTTTPTAMTTTSTTTTTAPTTTLTTTTAPTTTTTAPTTTTTTTTTTIPTTTTTAPTTTSTTTAPTTSTTAPTTTTPIPCAGMVYALPAPCSGCLMFTTRPDSLYCETAGLTLFATADPSTPLGSLTCTGGVWFAVVGGMAIPPMTRIFCGPTPTTTTTTTASTTTTTVLCSALGYGTPSNSGGGCIAPQLSRSAVTCKTGYELWLQVGPTQLAGNLTCLNGAWTDGATTVADMSNVYCKPLPTTAAPTTTTAGCARLAYDAPAVCGGCLSPTRSTTSTSCDAGYDLYLYLPAGSQASYLLMAGPLSCSSGAWTDGVTNVPDVSSLYCGPTPTTTTTTTTTVSTTTTTAICSALAYATPANSGGDCISPQLSRTAVTCTTGYELWLRTGPTQLAGNLTCLNGAWTDGATTVPNGSSLYCKPI